MSRTSDAERLLQALQSPRAYPHDVAAIEVLQTHISWIVLTGQFAYKIKKPVTLPFVDFGTLDRRRHCCREELRLNGRLAPQIYLEVVPITGTAESPSVMGEGEAIEYAVRMRQFSQAALLSRQIANGQLLPRHIDSLAQEIAGFHRGAAVAPSESRFGDPQQVWKPMEANLAFFERWAFEPQRIRRLRDWSRRQFDEHRNQFAARKAAGMVRECHGDLHLGNMLLLDDKPVLFDCIEFNEDLRWIDVQSDLAFAAMDLEDRGSPAYAHRLLNRYLEETGDYSGLAVFPSYFTYRALVRAMVAGIRLQQSHQPEQQQRIDRECRGYLDLAERHTRSSPRGLILTHGVSGSGKSSITQTLVDELGAVRVRSDVERKRLFAGTLVDRSRSRQAAELYSEEATRRTYDELASRARAILKSGFAAIVDATFLKRDERRRFQRLADDCSVPLVILDIHASEPTLRLRVARRLAERSDASDADLDVLARQLESDEPLDDQERAFSIKIDNDTADSLAGISSLVGSKLV